MANLFVRAASYIGARPVAGGSFHIPNKAALEITADLRNKGFIPCAISWTVPRLYALKQKSPDNYRVWMGLLGEIHKPFSFTFSLRLPHLHLMEDMLTRPDILEKLVPNLRTFPLHLNPEKRLLDLKANMYLLYCFFRDKKNT